LEKNVTPTLNANDKEGEKKKLFKLTRKIFLNVLIEMIKVHKNIRHNLYKIHKIKEKLKIKSVENLLMKSFIL